MVRLKGQGGKMSKRLIIIANRLPVTLSKREGKISYQSSSGGLATGLGSFYRNKKGLWLGWPGLTSENAKGLEEEIFQQLEEMDCKPVLLTKRQLENFYYGFSNKTLWPLFHYFLQYTVFENRLWEAYKKANQVYCEAAMQFITEDDVIWIHDYQLMLLPKMIRDCLPNATIGFFLHIPFPSFEIFRLLPWREEILDGLLGADLIGFHTYDYVRHFLSSVRRLLGYDHSLGLIYTSNRIAKVDTFPIGIDFLKFSGAAELPEVKTELRKLGKRLGNRVVILSIDRMDYSKGILQRLKAFDLFLEKYPQYREKVILVLVGVPSRTKVEHYIQLKKDVDEHIGSINGRYGTLGWTPIIYLYRSLQFPTLAALYNIAQVALVTPLRDGMNLIAKEYVASREDETGTLVLSEMAGAAQELGEAIIVNPYNLQEVADAMKRALEMDKEEQRESNLRMKERLRRYDIHRWAGEFMEKLQGVKTIQEQLEGKRIMGKPLRDLLDHYVQADNSLFLLDYDGTLVPFADRPEKARPDVDLKKILNDLIQSTGNRVVLISGRDKDTLEEWFGDVGVDLVAEHGVWIKENQHQWKLSEEPLQQDWKEAIKPILEVYVDRTPGAFIEEKGFSLVWHYRKTDPELGSIRSRELKDALLNITENFNLAILEGSKVIEVKPANINKGKAATKWLTERYWDFIMALGDDWTDEELFAALPHEAYTIKIGLSISKARFHLDSYKEARTLLKGIIQVKKESYGNGRR
jgi:trehalose 6-phosphate synthase/phosphatase